MKITQECPNLVYLNLSKLSISNFNLGRLIKKCSLLKELSIAHCTQITDSSLTKLFHYCKNLEKLNITFCHLITGKCFVEKSIPVNLKHLVIDYCENVNIYSTVCSIFLQKTKLSLNNIYFMNKR